jgi:hypothetical protein
MIFGELETALTKVKDTWETDLEDMQLGSTSGWLSRGPWGHYVPASIGAHSIAARIVYNFAYLPTEAST